jgi:pimeloyl-ACP methyl ester carboxylesterase
MGTVVSRDGTVIFYNCRGDGPPLVLVHGTGADHTRWAPLLPLFENSFTVYAIDRRGRGQSGDAQDYALQYEFEDIVAVVDSIGTKVNLLGHSYGGLCALESAPGSSNLSRLILYEPPLLARSWGVYPPEVLERMRSSLAAGDREGVVTTFVTQIVKVPAHELELLKADPSWPGRVNSAHTILREIDASIRYELIPDRFRSLSVPVLLLLGGDSIPFLQHATKVLHSVLPNSRLKRMPGQQHNAMCTAPDLFASEVLDFIKDRT